MVAGPRRRQLVIQLHARAPLDLRRAYRRRNPRLAKGLAVFALAELALHCGGGGDRYLRSAGKALELLDADRSAGDEAWGYPFDMQTRWSYYARDTPNVVVTTFAVRALHRGASSLRSQGYAARARRAAEWIQEHLFVEELGAYAYHPGTRSVIHNANLLGASTVWRFGGQGMEVSEAVARAVARTIEAQAADGSFPYGEEGNLDFVDSFHTGYVLDCLCDVADVDVRVEKAIERGAAYYCESFFDAQGRSRLWPNRSYPEDGHSAATALRVLSRLSARGVVARDVVERVASRAMTHLVQGDHAVHRRHRMGQTRVRYLRWCDAHLALGLAEAARFLSTRREPWG